MHVMMPEPSGKSESSVNGVIPNQDLRSIDFQSYNISFQEFKKTKIEITCLESCKFMLLLILFFEVYTTNEISSAYT